MLYDSAKQSKYTRFEEMDTIFENIILIFEIYPIPILLFLTVYCSQILRVSAHNIVNFQSSVSHWNVSTS